MTAGLTKRAIASASSQRTTQVSSQASCSGDSRSLITSTAAAGTSAAGQLGEPGSHRVADRG